MDFVQFGLRFVFKEYAMLHVQPFAALIQFQLPSPLVQTSNGRERLVEDE